MSWSKSDGVQEYDGEVACEIGGASGSQVNLYVDGVLEERCVLVTPEIQRAVLEAVIGHVYVGDSADLQRYSQFFWDIIREE